jgi:hypothetical protein
VMTANVEYIFFISFEFTFFETIMSSNATMSSDATRFAVCFDFLTRFSSMILLTFNFDELMFFLRDSAISRDIRSISDKSSDNERLSFIARLSRVDDYNDEIIDADSN